MQVSNIPSGETGNAASCAEHAIYLALALLRDQHQMAASIRERRVGVPLGQTLLGKTALLIGFGNIAKELVPRCPFPASACCLYNVVYLTAQTTSSGISCRRSCGALEWHQCRVNTNFGVYVLQV